MALHETKTVYHLQAGSPNVSTKWIDFIHHIIIWNVLSIWFSIFIISFWSMTSWAVSFLKLSMILTFAVEFSRFRKYLVFFSPFSTQRPLALTCAALALCCVQSLLFLTLTCSLFAWVTVLLGDALSATWRSFSSLHKLSNSFFLSEFFSLP